MAKKKLKIKKVAKPDITAGIKDVYLDEAARDNYYLYGTYTNEDRAIVSNLDGLKPVMRRALWAAHKLGLRHNVKAEKSAKVVGETIGSYHPHGDSGTYQAIINAANMPEPLIDGEGNWGTMSDPAAAYRYTNMRLSKFSDLVFFDRFYLPAMQMTPNYDGSHMEPLILPTLLPNAIINGNSGIGVGVATSSPSFVLKSVLDVLRKIAKGEEITPELCLGLEFISKYGGVVKSSKAARKEIKNFFKSGKGKLTFSSLYDFDPKKNTIRVDRFAPINIDKVVDRVEAVRGVQSIRDDSDKHDIYQKAFVIQFRRNLKGRDFDSAMAKIEKIFSSDVSFDIKVTDRTLDEKGNAKVSLRSTNIIQLLKDWYAYRIQLEKDACSYWIKKCEERIARLELMLLAVANRAFIIKALDKKLNDAELAAYIAKHLKITVDQANTILDLKVRQLKALEADNIKAEIKDIKAEIAGYQKRIKKPAEYLLVHFDELEKQLVQTVKNPKKKKRG